MAGRKKSEGTLAAPAATAAKALRFASSELMIGAALLLLLVTVGHFAWKKWGAPVTETEEYRVSAANIVVTPPPPWIRADVKAEAIRDGSLEGLSVLDKDLTIRVCRAFEMHAWVEKVNCVGKRPPACVSVELTYRQPVAWVEVPAGVLPNNEVGLLPVDKAGVLLPTADFTAEQANDYPRIAVSNLTPCGMAGTPWGDPRVVVCASIAAILAEDAKSLGLHRVLAIDSHTGTAGETLLYRVTTRKGLRLIWGSPPGRERVGEPTAAQKKVLLRQITESLANEEPVIGADEIDLRNADGALAAVRTARRSANPTR